MVYSETDDDVGGKRRICARRLSLGLMGCVCVRVQHVFAWVTQGNRVYGWCINSYSAMGARTSGFENSTDKQFVIQFPIFKYYLICINLRKIFISFPVRFFRLDLALLWSVEWDCGSRKWIMSCCILQINETYKTYWEFESQWKDNSITIFEIDWNGIWPARVATILQVDRTIRIWTERNSWFEAFKLLRDRHRLPCHTCTFEA